MSKFWMLTWIRVEDPDKDFIPTVNAMQAEADSSHDKVITACKVLKIQEEEPNEAYCSS